MSEPAALQSPPPPDVLEARIKALELAVALVAPVGLMDEAGQVAVLKTAAVFTKWLLRPIQRATTDG